MTASILDPGFADSRSAAVGDWMPSAFTAPLSPDFTTQGDKLLRFAERYWSIAEAERFELDEWQRWLIRHVLETYPPDWPVEHLRGQLRYRQVVISMGRQNGKSLLGALFVLYFLALHVRGPKIIGLASIDAQAKIVYDRVKYGIDQSPALSRELKTTETRGISRKDGSGTYGTLPAKEESAQGHPASGVLYDELHLGLAALWDAMVLAQRARRNSLLVGITTAGDDSSELLIRLYGEAGITVGEQLPADPELHLDDERYGFFLWQAASDELTEAGVIAANPAIACGRVPLDEAMSDARKMYADLTKGPDGLTGRQRAIRYTLNRFIKGAAAAWASLETWDALRRQDELVGEIVYGIERTPSFEAASITATTKIGDELHTELVASILEPSIDQLFACCETLATRGAAVFAMDSSSLGSLAKRLKLAGYETWQLGASETAAAAQTAAGAIARGDVRHAHDQLVRLHFARGRRREQDTLGWRLSRSLSTGDIDALQATVWGLYVADVRAERTTQLF